MAPESGAFFMNLPPQTVMPASIEAPSSAPAPEATAAAVPSPAQEQARQMTEATLFAHKARLLQAVGAESCPGLSALAALGPEGIAEMGQRLDALTG